MGVMVRCTLTFSHIVYFAPAYFIGKAYKQLSWGHTSVGSNPNIEARAVCLYTLLCFDISCFV